MKYTYSLIFLLLLGFSFSINAQVKISDSGSTVPDANSILELESTTKGFLGPRVTLVDLSLEAPLANPVPAGMLVYNSGNNVTKGYYVWNGTTWVPLIAGAGGVTVVSKAADDVLTIDETFVVASGDITLTLPTVTPVDNGLAITIKNVGSYLDQVIVRANPGDSIDGNDTIYLYRWKSHTFVAYNGNWLRKEKEIELLNTFDVGPTESWTDITEVLEFLDIHMQGPSVVRLDGGTYEVSATETIDLDFPLTIQGPSYGQAYIVAASGLTNTIFSCVSEVSFKMLAFEAGGIANINGLNLVTEEQYHEIKDCTFDGFYSAIKLLSNVDIWLFESDISNAHFGVEINVPDTSDFVSFYVSESDFGSCDSAIYLASGDTATVSIQNCTFTCDANQTALAYNATNFRGIESLFFTNNTWNRVGTFISGFDFTRTDGRDANVEILNNAGMEDKNPIVKVSVIDDPNSQSLSSPNTQWYTPSWAVDDSTVVNWKIGNYSAAERGNRLTYLPSNSRDVLFIVTGNIESSVNGYATVAIERNGTDFYGSTTLRFTNFTSASPMQFSTIIYIQNIDNNDYFRLRFQHSQPSGTVKFQDINIYADAQ